MPLADSLSLNHLRKGGYALHKSFFNRVQATRFDIAV